MKNLSLLLFVVTLTFSTAMSQELLIDRVDDFTGEITKITAPFEIGESVQKHDAGNVIDILVVRISETYGLYVNTTSDIGCSGANGNTIVFKFKDGTLLTLNDEASIDCSISSSSVFELNSANLKKLESNTIDMIRLSKSEGRIDVKVPLDNKYTVKELIAAVK
jgi:hypothetical protein